MPHSDNKNKKDKISHVDNENRTSVVSEAGKPGRPLFKFSAMASCYGMGVFNDNFFRQATFLLAVAAGITWYQGTAMALFALPYLVLSAPAGWLADRFPKRNVVIGAKALELAAMVCGAAGIILGSWALMLAMVCIMGTQSAIFNPALNGSIPELFPHHRVNPVNAKLRVFVTLAILFGVACAGIALGISGKTFADIHAGRALVAIVILTVALAGLATSFAIPHYRAAAPNAKFPWTGSIDTLKDLWRIRLDPYLTLAIGVITLIFFLGSLKVMIINELGVVQYGLGEGATSGMVFAAMAGVAIGGLSSSWVVQHRKWHTLMLPLSIIMTAIFIFIVLIPYILPSAVQIGAIFFLVGMAGIAGGLMVIPSQAFVQLRPKPEKRGAVIAACNFSVFSGILISGPAAGAALASFLPTTTFALLAAITIITVFVLTFRTRKAEDNTLNLLLALLTRLLLRLRYKIEIKGLDKIAGQGRKSIVFLPNHPALIDPVILLATLHSRFMPRTWAVEHQVNRPVIRSLARRMGVISFPAVDRSPENAQDVIDQNIQTTADELEKGRNYLIYPSGHAYRSSSEDLRGNIAAHSVLNKSSKARPVLVRTSGLWGSSFSWAYGHAPHVGSNVKMAVKSLLKNFIFFGPRRKVTIEFCEPDDIPRSASRETFNEYLENFYNEKAHPPIYVPYTIWETGGIRELPEPEMTSKATPDENSIPPEIVSSIKEHLQEISGRDDIQFEHYLGRDLGIDSLGRAELLTWLESEWDASGGTTESVQTVGDMALAAAGKAPLPEPKPIQSPPAKWYKKAPNHPGNAAGDADKISFPPPDTINEAFVNTAAENPDAPIIADQISGVLSYRRILTAAFALKPHIAAQPGKNIGIMLPATAGAGVVYMAALLAGKTPVMLNFTLGVRNLKHCIDIAGVERILSARALTDRLSETGTNISELDDKIIYLSDLRAGISVKSKINAALKARFTPGKLLKTLPAPEEPAVILFTSGSESFPKAVPLTHCNILNNIRDITESISIKPSDCLLGMLPPFHSFGLTVTLVLPLCLGIRTVYYPDPTDGGTLARVIDAYGLSLLVGTPTFLDGIINSPGQASLETLRLAVTGAEKCPENTYQKISERCSDAIILEGYGITECSPVVSVNDEKAPRKLTIGKVLPSFEYAIVDVETWEKAETGQRGMLLLRGPCVFNGYLGNEEHPAPDPFVEFEGVKWYKTGDLVVEDEEKVLKFCGRLKRFVKLGGEMVSLPAIEAALKETYPTGDAGPQIAVDSISGNGRPQIVLFSVRKDVDRGKANDLIKKAGLSSLHNINKTIYVDEIPVLGTGKTDYRSLKRQLSNSI